MGQPTLYELCIDRSRQRTAVELHHLDGYSVFEISKRMDRTKAGVAGLLRRGLKDLRERLIEKGLE